ncbi:MAG: hypothetical protein KKH74_08975 [Gammaproteobacteria bacterium]|nr:hypothetical protein [Gammaproteobacteria bacterium]MBU1732642.1 hypothetical protein [Gammaproteobacteria bacterium]MBU1893505.1 hypothetical protein [Gammaproteobacteria bacterium]
MSTHLIWTDSDTKLLNDILNNWAKSGFEGELDTQSVDEGIVAITTRNWIQVGAPFVTMEIHKIRGKITFFGGQKTQWVIRLFSCESYDRAFSVMHGCATGRNLPTALKIAMLDVGHGFASTSSLESYFRA